jgi:hypothetical protein
MKESIRCESIIANLDIVSKSAIFMMVSTNDIRRLYLASVRKDMLNSTRRERFGVQVIIKIRKFSFIPRIIKSHIRAGFMFRLWV